MDIKNEKLNVDAKLRINKLLVRIFNNVSLHRHMKRHQYLYEKNSSRSNKDTRKRVNLTKSD